MQLTINSSKYPGISLVVPEIPGVIPPTPGSHYFASGVAYDCSEATVNEIRRLMAGFEPRVSQAFSIQVLGDRPVVAAAVADPPLPPSKTDAEESADSAGLDAGADDVEELTEEDIELIKIEIDKIDALTIAKAEPILVATGGNPEIPLKIRKAYLEEIATHPTIQKTLKDVAARMLEQL